MKIKTNEDLCIVSACCAYVRLFGKRIEKESETTKGVADDAFAERQDTFSARSDDVLKTQNASTSTTMATDDNDENDGNVVAATVVDLLVPTDDPDARERVALDLYIAVDVSGSMSGVQDQLKAVVFNIQRRVCCCRYCCSRCGCDCCRRRRRRRRRCDCCCRR